MKKSLNENSKLLVSEYNIKPPSQPSTHRYNLRPRRKISYSISKRKYKARTKTVPKTADPSLDVLIADFRDLGLQGQKVGGSSTRKAHLTPVGMVSQHHNAADPPSFADCHSTVRPTSSLPDNSKKAPLNFPRPNSNDWATLDTAAASILTSKIGGLTTTNYSSKMKLFEDLI